MNLNYDPLYPDYPVTDQTLHVWARHSAFCNKPAFIWVDAQEEEEAGGAEYITHKCTTTLSYFALDAAASAIASHLHSQHGLQPKQGHILLVLYPPGLSFIKLLFGCMRAGLTIAPLLAPPSLFSSSSSSSLPPADLSLLLHIITHLRPSAVLAPSTCTASYTQHLLCHESLLHLRWIFINHDQLSGSPAHVFERQQYHSLSCHNQNSLSCHSPYTLSSDKHSSLSSNKHYNFSLGTRASLSNARKGPDKEHSTSHIGRREVNKTLSNEVSSYLVAPFTSYKELGSSQLPSNSLGGDKSNHHEHSTTFIIKDRTSSSKSTIELEPSLATLPSPNKLLHKRTHGFDEGGGYMGCMAQDVYLVQYTSGATGPPKPTLISAGATAHNARAARKAYDVSPSSIIVSWLPQYHDCGLMFVHLSIISGATSILTSPFNFAKNPLIWLHMLSTFRATCTPMPSFALPLVSKKLENAISRDLSILPIDLSSLRNLIVINEPIEKHLVDLFLATFQRYGLNQASIAPSYGLAENCTFVCTSWTCDKEFTGSYPTYNGLLPSARVCETFDKDEMDIRIVHKDSCHEVGEGLEGEVWVASPSNANGYLGLSNLTYRIFGAMLATHVHAIDEPKSFVRTGDTGVRKGEYIYITGRVQDMLIWNGEELHPHYIERLVYNGARSILRPGGTAAFSLVSSRTLVVLAEVQVKTQSNEVLLHKIYRVLQNNLASTNDHVFFVGLLKPRTLPKTTSGKLQRWKTKHLFLQNKLDILANSHILTSCL